MLIIFFIFVFFHEMTYLGPSYTLCRVFEFSNIDGHVEFDKSKNRLPTVNDKEDPKIELHIFDTLNFPSGQHNTYMVKAGESFKCFTMDSPAANGDFPLTMWGRNLVTLCIEHCCQVAYF